VRKKSTEQAKLKEEQDDDMRQMEEVKKNKKIDLQVSFIIIPKLFKRLMFYFK
jgi:hypothetical protein